MKEKIGQRIKMLREQKGLSQEEVAFELHVSRSAYERMENGKSNSWASHLEVLSNFFEVLPEYFVEDNEKSDPYVENIKNGFALQNTKIKTLNNISEKLIEQYEQRLKEKDELINLLKQQKM